MGSCQKCNSATWQATHFHVAVRPPWVWLKAVMSQSQWAAGPQKKKSGAWVGAWIGFEEFGFDH